MKTEYGRRRQKMKMEDKADDGRRKMKTVDEDQDEGRKLSK